MTHFNFPECSYVEEPLTYRQESLDRRKELEWVTTRIRTKVAVVLWLLYRRESTTGKVVNEGK